MSDITPAVIETALPDTVNSRSALAYEVYQGSTGELEISTGTARQPTPSRATCPTGSRSDCGPRSED